MKSKSDRQTSPESSPTWIGVVAGLAMLAIGLFAGMSLSDLARAERPDSMASQAGSPAPGLTGKRPPGPAAPDNVVKPTTNRSQPLGISPWQSTPDNTPPTPPGHKPAWEVNPPAPDPGAPSPPKPTPHPDPRTHVPPKHNPGGVDGTRGPRPGSGIDD